jgi:hypothetical protein
MTLQPVGGADDSAEPESVDARLERAMGLGAFTLSMDVPAGSWSVEAADPTALLTPAGERLVDLTSLLGRAGVRTAGDLSGLVAGDPDCARWDLGADACDLTPADGLAVLVGVEASEIERRVIERPDGSVWCVGTKTANGEVQYIARYGTTYLTSAGLADAAAATDCEAAPQEMGAESLVLDCGAQGFERHLVRILPDAIAARDPDGGLLLSLDMLVQGDKPLGQRYDADFARALLEKLVDSVASSAVPAGSATGSGPASDGSQARGADQEAPPSGG